MKKPKNTDIRKDMVDAIKKAFPNDIVDWPIDFEESYFAEIYPNLQTKLSQIKGATLKYERDPRGGTRWAATSEPDEDRPDWCENSYSYHLFFVSLTDDKYEYIVEDARPEDDDVLQRTEGVGLIGCAVAVSLFAPFAVIALSSMELYDDGGYSRPDIDPQIFTVEGAPFEMEAYFNEMMGEEALRALQSLRTKIITLLGSLEILILPDEEARKPVKWLQAEKEAFIGKKATGKDITVKDAFFFCGL